MLNLRGFVLGDVVREKKLNMLGIILGFTDMARDTRVILKLSDGCKIRTSINNIEEI